MTPTEIAQRLRQTAPLLRVLLADCNDELARWRPDDDRWSINEVLGHLIWADEFAFQRRIELIVTQDQASLPPLDLRTAVEERQDNRRALNDLFNEFESARQRHLDFVELLQPQQLQRSARYKDQGHFLAADFLYEWPYHDYGHLQQILANLRAKLLPEMSAGMQAALQP